MNSGSMFVRFAGIVLVCVAATCSAATQKNEQGRQTRPRHPALVTGPTGPIQQVPLESMEPVAPQVKYQNGQLTIVASNSTLAEILLAVRKETNADIDIPDTNERVVTALGPGPAQAVIAELLNGSHYNFILLGSAEDPRVLTRVVLVARTETGGPAVARAMQGPGQQPQPTETRPSNGLESASDSEVVQSDDDFREAAEQAQRQQLLLQEKQQSELLMQQERALSRFQVPEPVPEPGTLLLVGSGLLGLAVKKKRARRSVRK